MYAEMVEGEWRQFQVAAHALWGKVTGVHSGADAGRRGQAGPRLYTAYAYQSSIMPKILVGLLITMAILAITYSAAATLVNDAAANTHARTNHAIVLQQAAANYRRARAQCQRLPADSKDACIAEAHAEEGRARAVASLAPRSYAVALRSQTDAAIDARGRDSIVIEPACNVVARGQASLCEIQVRFSSANALAEAGTERPLILARANLKAGESRPFVQSRANGEARDHEAYQFNVAVASP
jgi:hypothetical protein